MTRMYDRLRAGDEVAAALATAQRWAGGLDAAGRAEAYGPGGRRLTRDLAGSAGAHPDADHLFAHWAPFIHIGV